MPQRMNHGTPPPLELEPGHTTILSPGHLQRSPVKGPDSNPSSPRSSRSRSRSPLSHANENSQSPLQVVDDHKDISDEVDTEKESHSSLVVPHPGLATSLAMAASESDKRSPLDLLSRVFPHMKRSVLQLIIQGCNGDVAAAIEQVLNTNGANRDAGSPSSPSIPQLTMKPMFPMSGRPFLPPHLPQVPAIKSAFSPIASMPSPPSHPLINGLRYAYGPAGVGARGLALGMPYPPSFLPNLASVGYNYGAMAAAAAAAAATSGQKNSGSVLSYGLCPCPYGPTTPDK